jgi:hypothetical protein
MDNLQTGNTIAVGSERDIKEDRDPAELFPAAVSSYSPATRSISAFFRLESFLLDFETTYNYELTT